METGTTAVSAYHSHYSARVWRTAVSIIGTAVIWYSALL